jgi:hypothetical protein
MSEAKLRNALLRIAEVAASAANTSHDSDVEDHSDFEAGTENGTDAVCTPKSLPLELQVRAARTAAVENPVNSPVLGFLPQDEEVARAIANPLSIAVLTSKYWGSARRTLTVSFMERTPTDLRNRILLHMNAWQSGIRFVFTQSTGQVRISRGGGGYWSYLGTDVTHISTSRPTMNLQGFTMATADREFFRVVRHETGHTLGFPHEHMRRQIVALIDPEKAYVYFRRTQGWDRATVDAQVLTPLEDRSIMATPPDQTSIMCYQLPGEITRNGRPILGGPDINATDRAFCQRIYPRFGASLDVQAQVAQDDSEFVEEPLFLDGPDDAHATSATAGGM